MTREIKCPECGKISIPTWNSEDDIPNCCDECIKLGWISDPKEVYDAKKNDTELSKIINVQSPYFKKPDEV
jgi:endogenous inhibitor of DNA gyrase (YacG/DUF329 family)